MNCDKCGKFISVFELYKTFIDGTICCSICGYQRNYKMYQPEEFMTALYTYRVFCKFKCEGCEYRYACLTEC